MSVDDIHSPPFAIQHLFDPIPSCALSVLVVWLQGLCEGLCETRMTRRPKNATGTWLIPRLALASVSSRRISHSFNHVTNTRLARGTTSTRTYEIFTTMCCRYMSNHFDKVGRTPFASWGCVHSRSFFLSQVSG